MEGGLDGRERVPEGTDSMLSGFAIRVSSKYQLPCKLGTHSVSHSDDDRDEAQQRDQVAHDPTPPQSPPPAPRVLERLLDLIDLREYCVSKVLMQTTSRADTGAASTIPLPLSTTCPGSEPVQGID